jgi:hypothetical protein
MKFFFFLAGMVAYMTASAQTPGTMSFSCDTYAPESNYGTKHVLAVWIQNTADPSVFIKTRAKYGNEDDHLISWVAISDKNLVDAVTGATRTSYGTITSDWDGKDVSGEVVTDGDYQVFIEMGWGRNKTDDHAVTSFIFTKGANEENVTHQGDNNFSNVSISWVPEGTTGISSGTESFDYLKIFPNPAKENITIDFGNVSFREKYTVKIVNELGQVVWKHTLDKNNINISTYSLGGSGTYFIQVTDRDRNVKALKSLVVQ